MAGSLNRVELIGNVGKDPEIRTSQDGKKIANLTLATSETWNDRQSGEKRERTEWHRVVSFNDGLSNVIEQYVKKGSKLWIEGQLQTRKYTDQQGVERYTTEIVLAQFNGRLILLNRVDGNQGGYDQPAGNATRAQPQGNRAPAQGGYQSGGGWDSPPNTPTGSGPSWGAPRGQGRMPMGAPRGGGHSGKQWAGDLDDEIPFAKQWQ